MNVEVLHVVSISTGRWKIYVCLLLLHVFLSSNEFSSIFHRAYLISETSEVISVSIDSFYL